MNNFKVLLFVLIFSNVCFSQTPDSTQTKPLVPDTFVLKHNIRIAAKAQFYFPWGDLEYMELHSNGVIYQMKKGLESGLYVAAFDKDLDFGKPIKDTAMVVTILDGRVHGLLQRWDEDDKTLAEECEYQNGLMHGIRKTYYTDPTGKKYTNIEFFKPRGQRPNFFYNYLKINR